jgi:hypothetical protein
VSGYSRSTATAAVSCSRAWGVPAPQAQRLPGDHLGAGGRPGFAALPVRIRGLSGLLDRPGVVATGVGGPGGAFPQHRGGRLMPVRGAGLGEPGGVGVAGGAA